MEANKKDTVKDTVKEDNAQTEGVEKKEEGKKLILSISYKNMTRLNTMKEHYLSSEEEDGVSEKSKRSRIVEDALEYMFKNKFVKDLATDIS